MASQALQSKQAKAPAAKAPAAKAPAVPRRTADDRAESKTSDAPRAGTTTQASLTKSVPPIRSDFDSSLFDEITTEKDREEGLPAIERAIQQAADELKHRTMPAPSDPQEVTSAKPASDAVRIDPLPPPPVFQPSYPDGSAMEPAPSSQGPPSSRYPMGYLSPSQAPPSQGPMSGTWMGNPVTVAPPGSIIVPPGGQLPSAGMLPLKWVVIVAMTAVASFALGLLVASGGVEVRLAQNEPAPPVQTAAPAPPPTPPPEVKPEPAPKPAPEPKVEDEPASKGGKDDGLNEDAGNLPVTQGYLVVNSPAEDGYVYVRGQRVGVVGKPLQVPCGLHFVRVGNQNVTRWHTHGRAVAVACQGVTTVNLPLALGPDPSQRPSGGQFINGGSKSGGVWTPGDL
jgi:hypothetical protein